MRLSIPSAPRTVRLGQVPGVWPRLARSALLGMAVAGGIGLAIPSVARQVGERRHFAARGRAIEGVVAAVRLPPFAQREGGTARLDVLYEFEGRRYQASGVSMAAEVAEGMGPGAHVGLWVDPDHPEHVEERTEAEREGARASWLPWALALTALGGAGLVAVEARRTARMDLEPLRRGALVWLTPKTPLPEPGEGGWRDLRISATYREGDQVRAVNARVRPGRSLVRNQEKVLAAVLSGRPDWARVVDEELAQRLGWYADDRIRS